MINNKTVQYPLEKSVDSPLGCIQPAYTKSIGMLNPGIKKAKSEASVSSYSNIQLKSGISGGGQDSNCLTSKNSFRRLSLSYFNG